MIESGVERRNVPILLCQQIVGRYQQTRVVFADLRLFDRARWRLRPCLTVLGFRAFFGYAWVGNYSLDDLQPFNSKDSFLEQFGYVQSENRIFVKFLNPIPCFLENGLEVALDGQFLGVVEYVFKLLLEELLEIMAFPNHVIKSLLRRSNTSCHNNSMGSEQIESNLFGCQILSFF